MGMDGDRTIGLLHAEPGQAKPIDLHETPANRARDGIDILPVEDPQIDLVEQFIAGQFPLLVVMSCLIARKWVI